MKKTIFIFTSLMLITSAVFSQNPFEGLVTPTPSSGVFQGQAAIGGEPASAGDWVAAFDEDGNIAGAQELIINAGLAYINLTIYGDDDLTDEVDEGINAGEDFVLWLWDSTDDMIYVFSQSFDCWYNNNGAPMDGCGDVNTVYDFGEVGPPSPWEDLVIPNPSSGYFIGQATIDEFPAGTGDWSAAFDEDGNCAGAAELFINDGLAYINMAIYGDDITTPDVDEGMNAGENFILKLWDSSIDSILEYAESFDCWYNNNGAPMDGCGGVTEVYDFSTTAIDEIDLNSGWNLISYDVEIENNAPPDVFAELVDAGLLVVVTGYGITGATYYDPALPPFLNTLTSIDNGFGYWVKVNSAAILTAEGVRLGDDFAKDLSAGWNLIGYWLENSQAPADAFAALDAADNLVVATGYGASGATYYDPALPPFLNTLNSLDNGFGYWLKVNEAVEGFQYPEP